MMKMNECPNFGIGISCDCPACTQSQQKLESDFYGEEMIIYVIMKNFNNEESLCVSEGYFTDMNAVDKRVNTLSQEYAKEQARLNGFDTVKDYLMSCDDPDSVAEELETKFGFLPLEMAEQLKVSKLMKKAKRDQEGTP